MMGLNIKNETAHQLAAELARLTGENMTKAVTVSLEQRIKRVKQRLNRENSAESLLAIGKRCAAELKTQPVAHGDFLYDENGLPK
jgi:antitoxin VapB